MAPIEQKEIEVQHRDVSYERRDISHRAVFGFLGLLALSGIMIHLGLWGIFRNWGVEQYAGHQTTNPIGTSNEELREIGGDPVVAFPMPRLQPDPIADLNKFRITEEKRLNSSGWVDPAAGRVHIPIEQAIDAIASSWPKQTIDEGRALSAPHGAGSPSDSQPPQEQR